ncbi:sensor histidine kinase [Streptomyces odontomachi]|uniref:sensor histidine kinase n=1 Tax=Streptomyces odontomachi TaxID=2944940 RepID=UPI00210E020C|nr:histidine kinase [Streptomyces sp. ODS25]
MEHRPRLHPYDEVTPPLPIPVPHRWNAVLWVLFGLVPPAIAVADEPATTKLPCYAVLVVLTLGFASVALFPGNRVLRPHAYLGVLVLGLGTMGWLMGSGAALFVVTLPQFWIYAAGPAASITLSGLAAAAMVVGIAAGQGPHARLLSGNVVFTLVGYAVSVLFGLLVRHLVAGSDEREARLTAELRAARTVLAETIERRAAAEERERLAREIHDTLAQGFASIIVLAEAARSGLAADPDRSAQQLTSIEQTARENLAEARILVGSAQAERSGPGSLTQTLGRVLDRFAEDTGITVDAELPDVVCDQPPRIALLRCLQESLANVRKHAGAGTVGVLLATHPHGIELEITDDGRGFDVAASIGFGLDGMRRRLAELGGELTVTSSLGDGTRVHALVPAHALH